MAGSAVTRPQPSPLLGSHAVTAGSVRLSTSWWQDGSWVLKVKAEEDVQGSFLVILAESPTVAVAEPAPHHKLTREPAGGDVRARQSGRAGSLRPAGPGCRDWERGRPPPLPLPFPALNSAFPGWKSDRISPSHLPEHLQ